MKTMNQFPATRETTMMRTMMLIAILIMFSFSACKKDLPVEPQQPETLMSPADTGMNSNPNSGETHELGVLLLSPEEYAKIPVAETPLESLKSVASSYFIGTPPVGNQGAEGSCVAFGTAYAARSIMWKKYHPASNYSYTTNIFSPEYVYNQIKLSSSCLSGAYVTAALNLMKNVMGVCRWSYMPYTDVGCSTFPGILAIIDGGLHKISGYATVTRSVSSIKAQINAGYPVIVAGPVDNNFMYLGYGVVLHNRFGNIGNHCYCIIGYDDSKNAFKFINSWGTGWATSGYGYIDYAYISQWWSELYRINS